MHQHLFCTTCWKVITPKDSCVHYQMAMCGGTPIILIFWFTYFLTIWAFLSKRLTGRTIKLLENLKLKEKITLFDFLPHNKTIQKVTQHDFDQLFFSPGFLFIKLSLESLFICILIDAVFVNQPGGGGGAGVPPNHPKLCGGIAAQSMGRGYACMYSEKGKSKT